MDKNKERDYIDDQSDLYVYDDNKSRHLSAIFGPIVAPQAEYEELFKKEGYDDYTDINIREKFGFVRFSTQARVDLFINKFNRYMFKGQQMRSSRSRSSTPTGKTLHLSGFDPELLSERAIYKVISPYGFIRRITGKRDFAFVEFDTHVDAQNVINEFKNQNKCIINGCHIKIAFARNEHHIDQQNLSIPLSMILPEDHKFWTRLQSILNNT